MLDTACDICRKNIPWELLGELRVCQECQQLFYGVKRYAGFKSLGTRSELDRLRPVQVLGNKVTIPTGFTLQDVVFGHKRRDGTEMLWQVEGEESLEVLLKKYFKTKKQRATNSWYVRITYPSPWPFSYN